MKNLRLIPSNSNSVGLEYDLRICVVLSNPLVMILGQILRNIGVVSSPFKVIRRKAEATQGKSTESELKSSSLDIQINALSTTMALIYRVFLKTNVLC